jgi:hypothetical protein
MYKLVQAARAPDYLWSEFEKGKVSYTALREIVQCNLPDKVSNEMLRDAVVDHKLGRPAIEKFRAAYKEHKPFTVCLSIALGEIKPNCNGNGNGHAEAKSIDDLAAEVAAEGTRLRAKAEMIYALLPSKTIETDMVFAAFWHMRQALKDMLMYIDDIMKKSLEKTQGDQGPRNQEVSYAAREREGGGAEGGGRPAPEAVADVADQPRQDRST